MRHILPIGICLFSEAHCFRIFSDSRLSFGTQLYGFTNGAFYVPMPRGCITIMHDKSYAANAIKHCVRPCDMTGKSAGLIMRKINAEALSDAKRYHLDETISWLDDFHFDDADNTVSRHSYRNRSKIKWIKHPSFDGRILKRCHVRGSSDASRQFMKMEAQVYADVRNVLEALVKGVTKNLNQEEMTEKKLRKIEGRVARQVGQSSAHPPVRMAR